MRKKRNSMISGQDPAKSQQEALVAAADGLASANFVMGDHSLALLVFADTHLALREVATAAWSDLSTCGAVIARENIALEAAWASLCPGNLHLRPRPGYISSLNMTALAPFHAYPRGEDKGYWGGPVAMLRTFSGEPYKLHFHVGDVGNMAIFGRVGSGKSTLIGFLIAQAERFGATVVLWDKDRGLKILTHALEGVYLELKNPTGLAPLKALTTSAEDLDFLTNLLRGCILSDGGPNLTSEEDRRLHLALRTIMALPSEDRWLEEVRAFLGVEQNGVGARLSKWCWGQEFGWIIDNPADLISLDAKVIDFDQTFILDNAQARGPVMATLYHYVDKLIDGRRLLFVIDEFWKSLLDQSFRDLVNDKLKTLRKRNSPMILATQSPRDALNSLIAHTIKEQCPSVCYFAPGNASWEDFGDQGMGQTRTEFDIMRGLPEGSGSFLLKQGSSSVRVQLPLQGLAAEIAVLSGRESTVRLFDRASQEIGGDIVKTLERFQTMRKLENAV
jgi:type IV secretion system protein VirB4